MIPVETAFELLDRNVLALDKQTIPLANAVGRMLAQDIQSDVDSPPHDKSVMDGFAVRSSDLAAGTNRLKIVETIIAGGMPTTPLSNGQATRIMTGAPIPSGSDAVVMVELTETETENDQEWVTIKTDSIEPEKHVLRRGVNFRKGQTLFTESHVVRASDIGLLAETGAKQLLVGGRPRVAVLPTGNELVDCGEMPEAGQIRNSNGPMLVAMARQLGLDVTNLGIGRDEQSQLKELIRSGLQNDLLLLSGGVSAGMMDLVPGILKELGVVEVFHKVCVKPGKPIWFGVLDHDDRRTCVFGLPGNPVSSLVGFQLFVGPTIKKMMGGKLTHPKTMAGELTIEHQTRGNRPTYWPGKQIFDDSPTRKIQPLVWRGSSDLFALGESEGLIVFAANSDLHPAGEQVQFMPFH